MTMKTNDQVVSEKSPASGNGTTPYLLMPISLLFLLLVIAVTRSSSLMTVSGIGAAIIVSAPLILATYALMATVTAGRGTVDLSVGPLMGFINVSLIQMVSAGIIESPVAVFVFSIGLGIAYQLVMAAIIIFIRVQPIIVSLSGFLALSGINLVILPRPGGLAPEWMQSWGAGTSIFSPVLGILVFATLAWLIFTRTAFYTHLRLMGSDERAAYTSGVPITVVRFGAHAIAGVFSGLAAITYTALISSGDPSQGTTYTLIAVTAVVLGGTSLAGGRGTIMGSLFGALNLYLITYVLATFNFGAVQSFVTDLAYGAILVASLLLTIALPFIQKHIKNFSPLLYFVTLSVLVFGVILHTSYDYAAIDTVAELAVSGLDVQNYLGPLEFAADSQLHLNMGTTLKPWLFVGIAIVFIPILMRILFSKSNLRTMNLLTSIIVISVVLLTVYFMSRDVVAPVNSNENISKMEPVK